MGPAPRSAGDTRAASLPRVDGVRVLLGSPWRAVCAAAITEDVDLIVVGSHGHSEIDHVFGTTAARIVDHADRPVLVVRTRVHPREAKRWASAMLRIGAGTPLVDGCLESPPSLARVGHPAGEPIEIGALFRRSRREVEEPRTDDAAVSPRLRDVGEVQIVPVMLGVPDGAVSASPAQLSIIGKDYTTEEHAMGFYNVGDWMKFWGKTGAFWGGLWVRASRVAVVDVAMGFAQAL